MLDFADDGLEDTPRNGHNSDLKNASSVNALLPLDNDRLIETDENGEEIIDENAQEIVEEVDPAKIVTKHDFVSSPWTKLGIVGGFFALGFGVVFLSLNNLMSGGGQTVSKPSATPAPVPTPFAQEKDGDAYAKLALQKQESDLKDLNGKEETIKEDDKLTTEKNKSETTVKTEQTTKNKSNKVTTQETQETQQAPPRRTVTKTASTSNSSPSRQQPRRNTVARVPSERSSRPVAATIPKVMLPPSDRSKVASVSSNSNSSSDPLADIERLRNLSSMGRVEYKKEVNTSIASSDVDESADSVSSETLESRRRRGGDDDSPSSNNENQGGSSNSSDEIQQLTPKWEPSASKTDEFDSAQSKQLNLANVNYLQEESQILEERAPQYLVVGSSTKATLVTPLMIAGDKPNKNLRFVAQLTEPIKSNTGEIAIPAGTQVAITVNGVDGGFGMDAEVAGILKDGTEYPIAPGTISILAAFGNPLIARPYKGKGGEIAGYDITLGSIAGLAKVGEIINRQDETTEDLPLGGTRTRKSGNNRNISGAFLEGAFSALAASVGTRTQTATTEVTSRPNVWYVPGNSKVTLRVNRSIKL